MVDFLYANSGWYFNDLERAVQDGIGDLLKRHGKDKLPQGKSLSEYLQQQYNWIGFVAVSDPGEGIGCKDFGIIEPPEMLLKEMNVSYCLPMLFLPNSYKRRIDHHLRPRAPKQVGVALCWRNIIFIHCSLCLPCPCPAASRCQHLYSQGEASSINRQYVSRWLARRCSGLQGQHHIHRMDG